MSTGISRILKLFSSSSERCSLTLDVWIAWVGVWISPKMRGAREGESRQCEMRGGAVSGRGVEFLGLQTFLERFGLVSIVWCWTGS